MGDTKPPEPSTPAPELYPGHAADLARQQRRSAEIDQANSNPLPGPLLDAFTAEPEIVAGFTVRPLVHYDFAILRKLSSPLLRQLAAAGGSQTVVTDEESYEIIYQFTRPIRDVLATLKAGRDQFRQIAIDTVGCSIQPIAVTQILSAVERQFVRAFSTCIQYGPPQDPEGGGSVFTPPPAEPTTDSAGGSTTSAD